MGTGTLSKFGNKPFWTAQLVQDIMGNAALQRLAFPLDFYRLFRITEKKEHLASTYDSDDRWDYRIALIFRGSKFSRIAVLENFVEIISRIRSSNMPHPHFSGARRRATKD